MAKIRLYTLAKELGIPSKELLTKLRSKGILVKSALSTIDGDVEAAARRVLGLDAKPKAVSQKSAPKVEEKKTTPTKAPEKEKPEKEKPIEVKAAPKQSEQPKKSRPVQQEKATPTKEEPRAVQSSKPQHAQKPAHKQHGDKQHGDKQHGGKQQGDKQHGDKQYGQKHNSHKHHADKPKHQQPSAKGSPARESEKKRQVNKKSSVKTIVPTRDDIKSQPKVTIIRADQESNFDPNEIDKEFEKEQHLLDIEESVKRRLGRSDQYGHRKRIVRVASSEGSARPTPGRDKRRSEKGSPEKGRATRGERPGPATQRQSFRGPGGNRGRRQQQQQQQAAPPVGRRGKYKKKKAARLEARQEAEAHAAAIERATLRLGESVTVNELATFMGISAIELVKKLMGMGVMASVNQRVDYDTACLLAGEYGFSVEQEAEAEEELLPPLPERSKESLKPRPPVVTVMGHVDHGKTSVLDAIRKSNVVAGESGGITQHIGAYQVQIPGGQLVTFLDTPGHEAFTAMRAHGAQVTDIAILVVAADDGVKPQTVEAIFHARAAEVPIIVALNKMDKPGINIDKVYQELSQHELIPEEWGGKTIIVKCSAKEGTGLDDLLEMVVLQAEMMELRAYPEGPGDGVVIESRMDKGRGPVATVLVRDGLINVGDSFVAGSVHGRVRAMENHLGMRVETALPAQPVEIMGFNALPDVADPVRVVESEQQARSIAEKRAQRRKQASQAVGKKPTLEDLLAQAKASEKKELCVVLRADVVGSCAAVREALEKLENEEGVSVKVIFSGTGTITESDVLIASTSGAVIVGFHVRPTPSVVKAAQDEGVEIRLYSVIYKAIEDMEDILNGMLQPKMEEVNIGKAEVRNVFTIPKFGRIAGCYISEGSVERNAEARLIRDGVEKYVGKIASLRRFKDDAKEVKSGFECGIRLENYQDVQEGDIIEAFKMQEVPRD